jgi:hypothetical protein
LGYNWQWNQEWTPDPIQCIHWEQSEAYWWSVSASPTPGVLSLMSPESQRWLQRRWQRPTNVQKVWIEKGLLCNHQHNQCWKILFWK